MDRKSDAPIAAWLENEIAIFEKLQKVSDYDISSLILGYLEGIREGHIQNGNPELIKIAKVLAEREDPLRFSLTVLESQGVFSRNETISPFALSDKQADRREKLMMRLSEGDKTLPAWIPETVSILKEKVVEDSFSAPAAILLGFIYGWQCGDIINGHPEILEVAESAAHLCQSDFPRDALRELAKAGAFSDSKLPEPELWTDRIQEISDGSEKGQLR